MKIRNICFYLALSCLIAGCSNGVVDPAEELSKENAQDETVLARSDIKEDSVKGTVLYSGESFPSYKDYAYIDFHSAGELFVPKQKPFVLNF